MTGVEWAAMVWLVVSVAFMVAVGLAVGRKPKP